MITLLFGILTGTLMTKQVHFDACLKDGFKSAVCEHEQKLCKLGKEKERCK